MVPQNCFLKTFRKVDSDSVSNSLNIAMAEEIMMTSLKSFEIHFQIQKNRQDKRIYSYFEMQNRSELSLLESEINHLESDVSSLNQNNFQGRNLGYYPQFDFAKFRQQLDVREKKSPNLIVGNLEEKRLKELQR